MLLISVIYEGFFNKNNDLNIYIKYGATIIISCFCINYIYCAIKVIIYYNL